MVPEVVGDTRQDRLFVGSIGLKWYASAQPKVINDGPGPLVNKKAGAQTLSKNIIDQVSGQSMLWGRSTATRFEDGAEGPKRA